MLTFLKVQSFGMRLYFRLQHIFVSFFMQEFLNEEKKEDIVDIDRSENGNISGFLVFKFNGILIGVRQSLM